MITVEKNGCLRIINGNFCDNEVGVLKQTMFHYKRKFDLSTINYIKEILPTTPALASITNLGDCVGYFYSPDGIHYTSYGNQTMGGYAYIEDSRLYIVYTNTKFFILLNKDTDDVDYTLLDLKRYKTSYVEQVLDVNCRWFGFSEYGMIRYYPNVYMRHHSIAPREIIVKGGVVTFLRETGGNFVFLNCIDPGDIDDVYRRKLAKFFLSNQINFETWCTGKVPVCNDYLDIRSIRTRRDEISKGLAHYDTEALRGITYANLQSYDYKVNIDSFNVYNVEDGTVFAVPYTEDGLRSLKGNVDRSLISVSRNEFFEETILNEINVVTAETRFNLCDKIVSYHDLNFGDAYYEPDVPILFGTGTLGFIVGSRWDNVLNIEKIRNHTASNSEIGQCLYFLVTDPLKLSTVQSIDNIDFSLCTKKKAYGSDGKLREIETALKNFYDHVITLDYEPASTMITEFKNEISVNRSLEADIQHICDVIHDVNVYEREECGQKKGRHAVQMPLNQKVYPCGVVCNQDRIDMFFAVRFLADWVEDGNCCCGELEKEKFIDAVSSYRRYFTLWFQHYADFDKISTPDHPGGTLVQPLGSAPNFGDTERNKVVIPNNIVADKIASNSKDFRDYLNFYIKVTYYVDGVLEAKQPSSDELSEYTNAVYNLVTNVTTEFKTAFYERVKPNIINMSDISTWIIKSRGSNISLYLDQGEILVNPECRQIVREYLTILKNSLNDTDALSESHIRNLTNIIDAAALQLQNFDVYLANRNFDPSNFDTVGKGLSPVGSILEGML